MSFTLPYASAINCEFVNSPDFMVTSDNLLKLYSINGGGGGGGDSYTKAESDARYLQLITAMNQTITQTPQFSNKLTIANGTGKLTLDTGQSAGSNRNIVIPNTTNDCEILLSRPATYQQVPELTINTLKIPGIGANGKVIITDKQNDGTDKVMQIPAANGNGEFIITTPTTVQTIGNIIISSYRPTPNLYIQANGTLASVRNYYFDTQSTKYANSSQYIITGESRDIANFETWKPNPFFTMTSSHNANPARNLTVPALSADSQVVVTNSSSIQTLERLNFNTGVFLKGSSNTNYVQVTSANQNDNSKYVVVPRLAAGCDMVVTSCDYTQTLTQGLVMPTLAVTSAVYLKAPSTSNYAMIKSGEQTIGNVTATLPQMSSASEIIVTNPTTEQIISGIKIRSYTTNNDYIFTNGENVLSGTSGTIPSSYAVKTYVDTASTAAIPKTDIVTTVTGVSDTKVPSEKAVKTYVDSQSTGSSIITYDYIQGGTLPSIPLSVYTTLGQTEFLLRISSASATETLCTFTLPVTTNGMHSTIEIFGDLWHAIPPNRAPFKKTYQIYKNAAATSVQLNECTDAAFSNTSLVDAYVFFSLTTNVLSLSYQSARSGDLVARVRFMNFTMT